MTHPIYRRFIASHVKYILDSNKTGLIANAFIWAESNEGHNYWSNEFYNDGILTNKARKKLQRYLDKRPK